MSFRVLHFAPDDKFIPLTQELYEEAFPGSNQFRILADPAKPFQYVKASLNVTAVDGNFFSSSSLQADFSRCDCVVIHSMVPAFATGVKLAPANVMVVWSGWGYDYYDILEQQLGPLLLPKTQAACRTTAKARRFRTLFNPIKLTTSLVRRLRKLLRSDTASQRAQQYQDNLITISDRIDVYSVYPSEVKMLASALPKLNAVYHMLHYYTTEDIFAKGPKHMSGPDILVGNSATPSNNHIEAFDALSKVRLEGTKIIVPLSYGSRDYADYVCAVGRQYFGNSFVALRDFLTLDEYNHRLQRCGIVVMNHVRQQAVGNICACLYKGAKVFLRRQNPLFSFYTGLGATVFSIDDIPIVSSEERPSSPEWRACNHETVRAFWKRDKIVSSIRQLKDLRCKFVTSD